MVTPYLVDRLCIVRDRAVALRTATGVPLAFHRYLAIFRIFWSRLLDHAHCPIG